MVYTKYQKEKLTEKLAHGPSFSDTSWTASIIKYSINSGWILARLCLRRAHAAHVVVTEKD